MFPFLSGFAAFAVGLSAVIYAPPDDLTVPEPVRAEPEPAVRRPARRTIRRPVRSLAAVPAAAPSLAAAIEGIALDADLAEVFAEVFEAQPAFAIDEWKAGFLAGGGPKDLLPIFVDRILPAESGYPHVDHESGFDPHAANPTSTARYLFQFLARTAENYGMDHLDLNGLHPTLDEQIEAGFDYIADRYGSPTGAKAFWVRNLWY